MTPSSADELKFMQAGWGKRTLSVTSDVTHAELSSLLKTNFPKMAHLEDRWLLYKAAGGHGRRKLSAVPLEAEGYTGSTLRGSSTAGKTMLYIVPLQDEIELTPLPASAPEFALMPKASCWHSISMTVFTHTLKQSSEDRTCQRDTLHTDMDLISCEEDVIRWVRSQVDSSKTFEICVSRDNMVERGLKLWKRKKNGSPVNPLRITFLGEPGIDTGALKKEFLSTMVAGIEKRLFEGESERGKMPKYSLNDLDDELFRTAGEVFAVSIAQGGPAPRFMQEWLPLIEDASDMTAHIQDILDCGYTGKVDMENILRLGDYFPFLKIFFSVFRAIRLHVKTKRMPMLQQLREVLKVYGLIKVMQTKPEDVDSHYIISHLAPELSVSGSSKQVKESKILEHFQDFLLELDDAQPDGDAAGEALTVSSVMQWMTGQAHRHLLLEDRQTFNLTVKFDHWCLNAMPNHTVCYPSVSACTDTITFPVAHITDYESFKTLLQTAIKYGAGFDRV
ncbi:G2/M phase-specific E3 ubiquitin-protein ligase-like [Cebidichthys violaceus]|uniref:G2/M phase-specific E3 ubiquitin-protein ligase-like n=1 Tax=Cebidichthys violaceus TaxID=271503 RepID=UPI0035CCA77A